jgi:hypothetical protein
MASDEWRVRKYFRKPYLWEVRMKVSAGMARVLFSVDGQMLPLHGMTKTCESLPVCPMCSGCKGGVDLFELSLHRNALRTFFFAYTAFGTEIRAGVVFLHRRVALLSKFPEIVDACRMAPNRS